MINNKKNELKKIINNNYKTHQVLKKTIFRFENIILDYYSNKNALPDNKSGVGIARKIGMDFALQFSYSNSLLCSLDADTLISKNYLTTISKVFKNRSIQACTINFEHQFAKTKVLECAIREYENELKNMALLINNSGSPYGHVSLGSAIVCTAKAYIAVGGMSKKSATEDFYFLQSLAKFTKIHKINDVLVYPSSRDDKRVYLGTGVRLIEYKKNKKFNNLKFTTSAYEDLKKFLNIVQNNYNQNYIKINRILYKKINNKAYNFIMDSGFEKAWKAISLACKSKNQSRLFFNQWFDAVKIIKFLKHLS